jgi:hypothetical protein
MQHLRELSQAELLTAFRNHLKPPGDTMAILGRRQHGFPTAAELPALIPQPLGTFGDESLPVRLILGAGRAYGCTAVVRGRITVMPENFEFRF